MRNAKTALIIVDMQDFFVDSDSALSTIKEQMRPFSMVRFCARVEKTVESDAEFLKEMAANSDVGKPGSCDLRANGHQ